MTASTILSRQSFATPMSSTQSQVDGLVTAFTAEATRPTTLASMVVGAGMYRLGRLGTMAALEGRLANPAVRALSVGTGLFSEAASFQLSNRALRVGLEGADPRLMQLGGPHGLARGTLESLVTFSALRGAGSLAREQNVVVQHALQSSAMVGGHQLTGTLGLTPLPQGNLAEQFLHAEATNLQMQAGLGVFHGLTGGRVLAAERSLELQLALRGRPIFASQVRPLDVREESMSRASSASSRLYSFNPLFLIAPKLLIGWGAGYLLSTLRPRAAIATLLGTGAALVGLDYLSGSDPQWIVDAAVLGGAAAYGYFRSRSLRRDMQSNPFRTEYDTAHPMRIPVPPGLVDPRAVTFEGRDNQVQIFNAKTEGDGFPTSFIWSVNPPRGLSFGQRFFYRFFDPMRFTFSMGRLARSNFSRLLIGGFASWKGIDLERFNVHFGQSRFRNFDEFFTRRLRKVPDFYPGAAPAEGKLLYMARGNLDQVLTIKGEQITLRDLLGADVAERFTGNVGVMITYLSPRDYHLSHALVDGKLVYHRRMPGMAWTVGPEIWSERSVEGKPGAHYLTFNARDVVLKETPYGAMATVYVAATNVYSTEIHPPVGTEVKAGMHEQSYHFGSTNVYVFEADRFYFPRGIHPGQQMEFGRTPFLIPRSEVDSKDQRSL